ncbi:MAG TPA: hypothetical protein V6C96_02670 [Vampirovibrionales bacterium]
MESHEFSQPFVFKMPSGSPSDDSIDLKWINEEFEEIGEMFQSTYAKYQKAMKTQKHPPKLLKQQFSVLQALANYQIALLEQQNSRQYHIQSESDVQEMLGQIESFLKNVKE